VAKSGHTRVIHGYSLQSAVQDATSLSDSFSTTSCTGTAPSAQIHGACASDDSYNIFCYGGLSSSRIASSSLYKLAVGTGTCVSSQLTSKTTLSGHAMAYSGVSVYVFGGSTSGTQSNNNIEISSPTTTFWKYDTSLSSWSTLSATGPTARVFHSMVADPTQSDTLWVFGGTTAGDNANALNDLWMYSGGSWTQNTAIGSPSKRYGHSSVVYNNNMFLVGGIFPYKFHFSSVFEGENSLSL